MDTVTVGPEGGEAVLLGEVLQDQVGGLLLHRPVSGQVSDVTDDLSPVEGMDPLVVGHEDGADLSPGFCVVVDPVVTCHQVSSDV